MADRFTEAHTIAMLYGEQRDLIVKIDEAFDYDSASTATTAFLRVMPSRLDVLLALDRTLALARGAHNRLDDTWDSNGRNGLFILIVG